MPELLKLALLENAIDFLLSSTEYAQKQRNPRAWKYSLIHLASSQELLLKTILEKEHWSLLFESVDKATLEAFQVGDFKSVSFDVLLQRLNNVSRIRIAAQDAKYLRDIQDMRNRLLHFAADLNLHQVRSIVARGINIFLDLYKEHLPQAYDEVLGAGYKPEAGPIRQIRKIKAEQDQA